MVVLHRVPRAGAASRAIGSNGAAPHRVTCKARKRPGLNPAAVHSRRTRLRAFAVEKLWRINYYAARRSGHDQENLRRASSRGGHERMSHPPAQHLGSHAAETSYAHAPSHPNMDPRVLRRRSVDYSARRSGGDPENERRRSASASPAPSFSSYTPEPSSSSSSSSLPPSNGPRMDPRVLRRKSVDYAARRSGGSSARDRAASVRRSSAPQRSQSNSWEQPSTTDSNPSYASEVREGRSASAARPDPRVIRRKSIDYSARRSGGDPENSRRRVAAVPAAYQSSTRSDSPTIVRRKSVDYASRRSGGQEENARRRSAEFSYTSTPVPNPAGAAAVPSGSNGASPGPAISAQEALERVRRMAQRRRSTPDYAARRSGGDPENNRRRSVSTPPSMYGGSYNGAGGSGEHSSNGAAARAEERATKPYIARKRIASYDSRRSRDFEGRPGHPQRRRSMARFTLNEVKSALLKREKVLAAQRGSNGNGARPSVLENGARVDYGAHALRSVEGLIGAYSDLTGVPVHALKANLTLADVRVPHALDPGQEALRSLDALADLFARVQPASTRW